MMMITSGVKNRIEFSTRINDLAFDLVEICLP